jgi:hypothetical protein
MYSGVIDPTLTRERPGADRLAGHAGEP